jgi:hypothetical protein
MSENTDSSSPPRSTPPPVDVKWHHEALTRIAPKNKKLQADSEAAVQNVIGTMKSPLNMGQLPCAVEHEALLKCISENAAKANGSKEVEQNSLFRQNLTLATTGNSRRHFEAVEEMSKTLPDKMPSSRLGLMLQPCQSALLSFRKCSGEAVESWYQILADMHNRSQQGSK